MNTLYFTLKTLFFLGRFFGQERVFFLFSYFLVFFYKFPPQASGVGANVPGLCWIIFSGAVLYF